MTEQDQIEKLLQENKILKEKLGEIHSRKEKKQKTRSWLLKKSSTPLLGVKLKKSITNAINEYKESKTVSVDTASDVTSNIIWRVTRIGLFAFLMAVVPSLILLFQVWLLRSQNNYIENQTHLIETERRSSLVFVMSDVLSDLNREINNGGGDRNISSTLEARIKTLCLSMKPYRHYDFEKRELTDSLVSPERSQLFYNLLESNLGKESFQDILNTASFDYTSLKGIIIGRGRHLKYARLNYSDFSGSKMDAANLEGAELISSNLEKVTLSDAKLKRTNFTGANLRYAELLSADLTGAKLEGTNLSNADLSEAILWGAKLKGANFTNITLDNAIVNRADWIRYIEDELDLEGADQIKDQYRIKKQGEKQFVLVSKKKK